MKLPNLKSTKLVTFDVTGTLLRFRQKPVSIYIEVGRQNGIDVLDPDLMSRSFKGEWVALNKAQPHYGTSWRDWWTQFVVSTFQNTPCRGATPERLSAVASDLIRLFNTRACWEVEEEGLSLLRALKAQGLSLGVISNFDPRLHQLLCAHDLTPYFDFVLTSHECQLSKPDPKMFRLAFNLGKTIEPELQPNQVLHVGDSYELDYLGARGQGWKACLISKGEPNVRKDQDCPVFWSLADFYNYVVQTEGTGSGLEPKPTQQQQQPLKPL